MQEKLHDRTIYFHIKKKPEVHLIEDHDKSWAEKHLTRINDQRLVYYTPECSRVSFA